MNLRDPSIRGTHGIQSVIYTSTGVEFDGSNRKHQPFLKYNQAGVLDDVTGEYVASSDYMIERRVDLSPFLPEIPDYTEPPFLWPFSSANTPLYGHLRVPIGTAPRDAGYPLALFVQGEYSLSVDSAAGYIYLCDLLASHGIVCASIGHEYLLGRYVDEEIGLWPKNGMRVIGALEHIKQFRLWNEQVGHPLCGKVDLSRVMIVGQSNGGMTVVDMSHGNTLDAAPVQGGDSIPLDGGISGLGPYHFGLQAVVAIAPSYRADIQAYWENPVRDNFFLLIGALDSQDGGYNNYYEANPIEPPGEGVSNGSLKGIWRVYGGNHNYFNTEWISNNRQNDQAQELGSWPSTSGETRAGPGYLTMEAQCKYAELYVGAIAQCLLNGREEYLSLLQNHTVASEWGFEGAPLKIMSQYQSGNRLLLQRHRAPALPFTPSVPGKVTIHGGLKAESLLLSDKVGTQKGLHALRLDWDGSAQAKYALEFEPCLSLEAGLAVVSMTLFQREEENPDNSALSFSVEAMDGSGNVVSIPSSDLPTVLLPEYNSSGTCYRLAMQTIRVPLDDFPDPATGLRSIALVFNGPEAGVMHLGDIILEG